jgi:hypothetical protein
MATVSVLLQGTTDTRPLQTAARSRGVRRYARQLRKRISPHLKRQDQEAAERVLCWAYEPLRRRALERSHSQRLRRSSQVRSLSVSVRLRFCGIPWGTSLQLSLAEAEWVPVFACTERVQQRPAPRALEPIHGGGIPVQNGFLPPGGRARDRAEPHARRLRCALGRRPALQDSELCRTKFPAQTPFITIETG